VGVGAAAHTPGLLGWIAFAALQLTAVILTLDLVLSRWRHQCLYDDVVRTGLAKCTTPQEVRDLLADLASTHPDHLGRRLPYRKSR
jgi:hypothetical protein